MANNWENLLKDKYEGMSAEEELEVRAGGRNEMIRSGKFTPAVAGISAPVVQSAGNLGKMAQEMMQVNEALQKLRLPKEYINNVMTKYYPNLWGSLLKVTGAK